MDMEHGKPKASQHSALESELWELLNREIEGQRRVREYLVQMSTMGKGRTVIYTSAPACNSN